MTDKQFTEQIMNIVDPNDNITQRAIIKLVEEKFTSTNTASPKLFSKYKEELETMLRPDDDEVLKRWWMAGASAMHSIIGKQLRAGA